jgi:CheY-like chemotaxis protein
LCETKSERNLYDHLFTLGGAVDVMRPRILYGDNNEKHLESWGKILDRAGYEVILASREERVRELVRDEIFDLAVLDLHWDEGDNEWDLTGLDLAREVSRFTRCILLSGVAAEEIKVTALRQGWPGGPAAVNFVMKDRPPEVLLQAVKNAIVPRVFVVHGHDNEAALLVERLLGRIRVQPVVLRDLPGSGKAIIEKLERYSNVSFAVVLLTPDDFGGKKTDPPSSRSRARQNVIFELGFFVGKLGRNRVAILHKQAEDLELPSDYVGVHYIVMDSGKSWQVDLVEEMRAAGIEVNL